VGYDPVKFIRKSAFHLLFILPKSSFGDHKLFDEIVAAMRGDFLKKGMSGIRLAWTDCEFSDSPLDRLWLKWWFNGPLD